MKRAPVYDIRTSENAWNTLVALTGVARKYGRGCSCTGANTGGRTIWSKMWFGGMDRFRRAMKNGHLFTKAYTTAFGAPSEEILLLKNGVQIPPDRIIDISPLSCW